MEFHNMVNYMKAGLLYSDMVTTVSDTYAKEIQTPQYAYGLEGVLQCRSNYLCGIVNGIDYSLNDPATSTKIYKNFDVNSLENKTANKLALQEELGLPVRAYACNHLSPC
jgi:starch synthase